MYRFLLSRQWVILTVLGLVMIPVMIRLGYWQLHRHENRVANNEVISANLSAEPVRVESVTEPGAVLAREDLYRVVTAEGRYDSARTVVARQRTDAGGERIGYHVITPLVLDGGGTVLVNRGWVSPGDDITVFPKIPAPPAGEVTVTGRLRPDETTSATGIRNRPGLPPGQISLISSTALADDMPRTLVSGYLELVSTTPGPTGTQPQLIPSPDASGIGPHLAYAIQWWLFAAMVPVGWVVLLRRERAEIPQARPRDPAPAA